MFSAIFTIYAFLVSLVLVMGAPLDEKACTSRQLTFNVADYTRVVNTANNQAWRGPSHFGLVRSCDSKVFIFNVEAYNQASNWWLNNPREVHTCRLSGVPNTVTVEVSSLNHAPWFSVSPASGSGVTVSCN